MGLKQIPPAGTPVQFTGVYLKSTGQKKGSEGLGRWTVEACDCGLCAGGRHVAVNERAHGADDPNGMYSDLPAAERAKLRRHIEIGNLQIVGAKPRGEDHP